MNRTTHVYDFPVQIDLDRQLSHLADEALHLLMMETGRLMAEASKAGTLHGSDRIIITFAQLADQIHGATMKRVASILRDYAVRLKQPAAEITAWARPRCESLANGLLERIPSNDLPDDHKRIVAQYRDTLQRRLNVVLGEIENDFDDSTGEVESMGDKNEWITAADAARLLKPVFGTEYMAQKAICKRAHAGLIRARATRFMVDNAATDNQPVRKEFWWAEGDSALAQDWPAGDFETWVDRGATRLRAFGVSFLRADIEKLIPASAPASSASEKPTASPTAIGGRPAADWWDDILIETCFQHFRGDLQPKKQADVERAMKELITARGYEAADSTIRLRAKKVYDAIKREAEN